MVVDILSCLIRRAEEQNLIKGFKIANRNVVISHLQFDDDTIVLCEARDDYIKNLKLILRCLERISSLKVNIGKCKVAGLNFDDMELSVYAQLLGCEKETWPLKYLGLPLGGKPKSFHFGNQLLKKWP